MNKFLMLILMSVFAIAACREPGPAEQAGRSLDEAAAELRDRASEIGSELSESAQEACEEVAGALGTDC